MPRSISHQGTEPQNMTTPSVIMQVQLNHLRKVKLLTTNTANEIIDQNLTRYLTRVNARPETNDDDDDVKKEK